MVARQGLRARMQGTRRSRCGDIVHRRQPSNDSRRALTPCRPSGCGAMGPSAALPLLNDAPASPASRRLASGPIAPQRGRLDFYHGLLGGWCEMEFVRFASAAGPDARRRDAVDAGVSARSGNAAEGPAPPQSVRTPFHTSLLAARGESQAKARASHFSSDQGAKPQEYR